MQLHAFYLIEKGHANCLLHANPEDNIIPSYLLSVHACTLNAGSL